MYPTTCIRLQGPCLVPALKIRAMRQNSLEEADSL